MGTYVELWARQPHKVNEEWSDYLSREGKKQSSESYKAYLVYSRAVIESEIAFIQTDPSQAHLRYIKTVQDWCDNFPAYIPGRGSFKLSGISSDDLDRWEELVMMTNFVVRNKSLFSKIEGLDDKWLREMQFPQELISMLGNNSRQEQDEVATDVFYYPDAWVVDKTHACS